MCGMRGGKVGTFRIESVGDCKSNQVGILKYTLLSTGCGHLLLENFQKAVFLREAVFLIHKKWREAVGLGRRGGPILTWVPGS